MLALFNISPLYFSAILLLITFLFLLKNNDFLFSKCEKLF